MLSPFKDTLTFAYEFRFEFLRLKNLKKMTCGQRYPDRYCISVMSGKPKFFGTILDFYNVAWKNVQPDCKIKYRLNEDEHQECMHVD